MQDISYLLIVSLSQQSEKFWFLVSILYIPYRLLFIIVDLKNPQYQKNK